MGWVSLEEAPLILNRWAENAALLNVFSSEQPGEVLGSRLAIVEANEGGALLKSSDGTQFRMNLSSRETKCLYAEPRQFSEHEEYREWFSQLSDSEKLKSCLGFSFFVRVVAPPPMADALVPVGRIVLTELGT